MTNERADAVAKEDSATARYSGNARAPSSKRQLNGRATDGYDDDDDEAQYEGDGIVADDEVV